MNKFLLLLSVAVLSGCNTKQQQKEQPAKTDFINDSLYLYKNFRGILKDEWLEEKAAEKYFLLDSITTDCLLNNKNSPIQTPYYGARCVAIQNKIGNVRPIILYVLSDDYNSYLLVLLDEKNKPISYKEISGGWFFFPDSEGAIMQSNENRYCNIVDDRTINYYVTRDITLLDTITKVVGEASFKDSLFYRISIEEFGAIEQKLIDSIRIPLTKNEN